MAWSKPTTKKKLTPASQGPWWRVDLLDGSTYYIYAGDGKKPCIQNGALVFTDATGYVAALFAAGTWQAVVRPVLRMPAPLPPSEARLLADMKPKDTTKPRAKG